MWHPASWTTCENLLVICREGGTSLTSFRTFPFLLYPVVRLHVNCVVFLGKNDSLIVGFARALDRYKIINQMARGLGA